MPYKHKTDRPFEKPALYFITDGKLIGRRPLLSVVKRAVAGGASVIQLREKDLPAGRFMKRAEALSTFLRKTGALFIINDRVDVALACNADGVHLGQDDFPIADARKILGHDKIIGASCHTVAQAKKAQSEGADYIGAGQVFHTATKNIVQHPINVKKLAAIVKSVSIPVIAIGGIKPENASAVMKSGCAGIAVISAIATAKNPEETAQRLLAAIRAPG